MLTSEEIKKAAARYGADVCGIGDISRLEETRPSRDPRMILPGAKSLIGLGFRVPPAFYENMSRGRQFFAYTTLGVKVIDEEMTEMLLMRMASLIEDEGYDACLQRNTPNLKTKEDQTQNPEILDTVILEGARPVSPGKPPPDVILDFAECARLCGLGIKGLSGRILSPRFGPYVRFCFIITDMPLESDPVFERQLCDRCLSCAAVCPGKAIDAKEGIDTWQCSVYYRGAHKSNPLMKIGFLAGKTDREAIINGEKHFDPVSARALYPELDFLPSRITGYAPCLCGKACDKACWDHLKERGILCP
jgi:epoxyqueuosine reductase QueG